MKKKTKFIKFILSMFLILLFLASSSVAIYTLFLYRSADKVYAIFGIAIVIYLFLFLSYLLLRSIKKKKMISLIIPAFFVIIFILAELVLFYYLTKVYKSIDSYSNNENMGKVLFLHRRIRRFFRRVLYHRPENEARFRARGVRL